MAGGGRVKAQVVKNLPTCAKDFGCYSEGTGEPVELFKQGP